MKSKKKKKSARERREWKRGAGCESVLRSDMHWCSCSSRSNAASVLCSSSSRLPSAPLNYSPPEDVQCGCLLLLLLSFPPLHLSVSHLFPFLMWWLVSHVRQRTEVSTYKLGNPPRLSRSSSIKPPPLSADCLFHSSFYPSLSLTCLSWLREQTQQPAFVQEGATCCSCHFPPCTSLSVRNSLQTILAVSYSVVFPQVLWLFQSANLGD